MFRHRQVVGRLHCESFKSCWKQQSLMHSKCVRTVTRWFDCSLAMVSMHLCRTLEWAVIDNNCDELLSMWKSPLLVMSRVPLWKVVTWLILPVVICLSQRLSHACLSINKFVLWNCEWLIKSVIVYLMISYYMDNCGNSRANTCIKAPTSGRGVFIR